MNTKIKYLNINVNVYYWFDYDLKAVRKLHLDKQEVVVPWQDSFADMTLLVEVNIAFLVGVDNLVVVDIALLVGVDNLAVVDIALLVGAGILVEGGIVVRPRGNFVLQKISWHWKRV